MFVKASFDVRYSSTYFNRAYEADPVELPDFLSTHPTNKNRIKYLEELMPIVLMF